MSTVFRFVATVPKGFSDLLATEVGALGAQQVRESAGGVSFEGTLATGYRVLL
jgi:23S rRNA G2445 N2-methylase RlmL